MSCNSLLANVVCFTCTTLNKVYLILSQKLHHIWFTSEDNLDTLNVFFLWNFLFVYIYVVFLCCFLFNCTLCTCQYNMEINTSLVIYPHTSQAAYNSMNHTFSKNTVAWFKWHCCPGFSCHLACAIVKSKKIGIVKGTNKNCWTKLVISKIAGME